MEIPDVYSRELYPSGGMASKLISLGKRLFFNSHASTHRNLPGATPSRGGVGALRYWGRSGSPFVTEIDGEGRATGEAE
jgi:hypothetical protein